MTKKTIILFYENLIRDYRGLLLLQTILKRKGHRVSIFPLWNNAIDYVILKKPDLIVMGQIGEQSTSVIGLFCVKKNISLVLNTTEIVHPKDFFPNVFKVNFKEYNSEAIDMQTLANKDLLDYVNNNPIPHKEKYKLIGMPRFDLSSNDKLSEVEVGYIKNKYRLSAYKKIFLYVSSFIYDDTSEQVDKENQDILKPLEKLERERKDKEVHSDCIQKFLKKFVGTENVLLIKKHPWDKSDFFKNKFASNNCIILEEDECIVPLLKISDLLIHQSSTVAIEAWIMNKKTICLYPYFDGDRGKLHNHMKYELIVSNFEELEKVYLNYPDKNPSQAFLKNFEPNLDGKSTLRLAEEITKLPTKKNTISLKERLDICIKKAESKLRDVLNSKPEELDTKGYMYHFKLWERKKPYIKKIYKKPFNLYIKENA